MVAMIIKDDYGRGSHLITEHSQKLGWLIFGDPHKKSAPSYFMKLIRNRVVYPCLKKTCFFGKDPQFAIGLVVFE